MAAFETMTKPLRLQLSRRMGFDLQARSRHANGLAAVRVARPGKWGNPFRIGIHGTQEECVAQFRDFAAHKARTDPAWLTALAADLRGKNLACWCRPGEPCHADMLLALANRPGSMKT